MKRWEDWKLGLFGSVESAVFCDFKTMSSLFENHGFKVFDLTMNFICKISFYQKAANFERFSEQRNEKKTLKEETLQAKLYLIFQPNLIFICHIFTGTHCIFPSSKSWSLPTNNGRAKFWCCEISWPLVWNQILPRNFPTWWELHWSQLWIESEWNCFRSQQNDQIRSPRIYWRVRSSSRARSRKTHR